MPTAAKERLDRDGFVIADVFSGEALDRLRQAAEPLSRKAAKRTAASDPVHSIRYDLFAESNQLEHLHYLTYCPEIMAVAEALFGPELIMEGAALIVAVEGVPYKQGWHRDVLQIPEDQIDERMFSPAWFHNCLQFNLAILDDAALWIVPGSHCRPLTPGEEAAFGGSKHMSPIDAEMPGGQPAELQAGQAVFYNNNLIHRGFNEHRRQRMTLHGSYHASHHPPTWHFYGKGFGQIRSECVQRLNPTVQRMFAAHQKVSRNYPKVEDSYRLPANFAPTGG